MDCGVRLIPAPQNTDQSPRRRGSIQTSMPAVANARAWSALRKARRALQVHRSGAVVSRRVTWIPACAGMIGLWGAKDASRSSHGGFTLAAAHPILAPTMFYTYILASAPNGTLYTGHTDSLATRAFQHREEVRRCFTSRYGVKLLVWYERHDTRDSAKRRESQMKKWNRAWKIRMILELNPGWDDLLDAFLQPPPESLNPGQEPLRPLVK